MVNKIFGSLLVMVLALSLAAPVLAQDAAKKETKKTVMKEPGTLKEVTCDPACGFSVRSRNEKELISMVKQHAKTCHKMNMTDAQVKEKMKDVK